MVRREAKVVILIAALAVIGVAGIAVILTSFPLNPSRSFSIGELRSGTNFTLGGVRFNQTGSWIQKGGGRAWSTARVSRSDARTHWTPRLNL